MRLFRLALLLHLVPTALAACATDVNRSLCEGFQARVRVVDPLADPMPARDQVSCAAYQAERARLLQPRAQ